MEFTPDTTSTIDLIQPDPDSTIDLLYSRLNALTLSTEGTLPGNRAFGLKRNFLSRPPRQARNLFAIELSEKAAIYIPEVSIKAVDGEISGDGMEDITVTIERSGKG